MPEQKKSSGFPFALILFVVGIAVFVDGFSWFAVRTPVLKEVRKLEVTATPTNEPTTAVASPSATATATPSAIKSLRTPNRTITSYPTK